jgi:hypothetical protein
MMREARDPNPISGCLSPYEEIRIVCDAIGIDLNEAVAERRAKLQEEQQEKERLQVEKARLVEEARRAKNKANFERFIRDQGAIVLFDKQPVKVVPFCKNGGELGSLQKVYDITATARGRLSNGRIGQSPGTVQAAEASIDVPCTCEKGSHRIRVFISGN